MKQDRHIWTEWAKFLHRWGVQGAAAWLLEVIGPVQYLGAQAIYFGQPFLQGIVPARHMQALAEALETPQKTQALVQFLRESAVT